MIEASHLLALVVTVGATVFLIVARAADVVRRVGALASRLDHCEARVRELEACVGLYERERLARATLHDGPPYRALQRRGEDEDDWDGGPPYDHD